MHHANIVNHKVLTLDFSIHAKVMDSKVLALELDFMHTKVMYLTFQFTPKS